MPYLLNMKTIILSEEQYRIVSMIKEEKKDYRNDIVVFVNDVRNMTKIGDKSYEEPVTLHFDSFDGHSIPDIRETFKGLTLKIENGYLIFAADGFVGKYVNYNDMDIHASRKTIGGIAIKLSRDFLSEKFQKDIVKFLNVVGKKLPIKSNEKDAEMRGKYDLSFLVHHKDAIINYILKIINDSISEKG